MQKRRRTIKPGMERVYLGERVIRVIPCADALRLVKQRKAENVIVAGVAIGVRLMDKSQMAAAKAKCAGERKSQSAADVVGMKDALQSCAVLSIEEAERAIGFEGVSKTEGLPKWARTSRAAQGLEEVDAIELARVKLNAFAPVYRA
jgi:hypothetical protein